MLSCVLFAWLAPSAGETLTDIVSVADFEPPTYVAGASFHGIEGWTNLVATGTSRVTPDGGGTGVAAVLDGTQSAVLTSSVRFSMGRGWGTGNLPIGEAPWVLRGVLAQLTPGGQSEFWLSATAGIGGASTIAGLIFHSGGTFHVLDDIVDVDTGAPWTAGHAYLVDLVLDVPADRYKVMVEDLTGGSGRQALATGLAIGGGAGPPAIVNLVNNGGVLVVDDGAGSRTVFDTILLAAYEDGPDTVAATEVDLEDVPVFTFSGEPGEVYRLQVATNSVESKWTDLPYLIEGADTGMTAYDPASPDPHKIYRVAALPPTFVDRTAELLPEMANNKAAWGDFNNDGFPDLLETGAVWRNDAGFGFTQVGGSVQQCVWGDYNNDGFLDLFSWVHRAVYQNQNGTSFVSNAVPVLPMQNIAAANWGDWDGDGFLDLYVGGYESPGYEPDAILHNNGGASFTVSWQEPAGFRPGRGIASCDFDRDGDMDVYVSNYRLEQNMLWRNDGTGVFTDVAASFGALGGNAHTISSVWGDLDNDGFFDLFVGNFAHPGQPESQFLQNLGPSGGYHFADRSATAALAFQESYASATLGDYDNDGDLDLFLTTVYDETQTTGGVENHAVLYRNNGNWLFEDVTEEEGLLGIETTYQAAFADFDRDGDLDLAAGGKFLVNTGNRMHWLEVRLSGNPPAVNASAIGAQVKIQLGARTLVRQVGGWAGEGNQNALVLHFGLGAWGDPVDLEVFWPNGATETVSSVAVDQIITIAGP